MIDLSQNTATLYILLRKYSWSEWHFGLTDMDPSKRSSSSDIKEIVLETREVALPRTPSAKELAGLEIDQLQEAIEAERKASAQRIALMQDKISQLACLEHHADEQEGA